jgi:hypothetical protein
MDNALNNQMISRNETRPRWWEGYLFRYLTGTVTGAMCILYLVAPNTHSESNVVVDFLKAVFACLLYDDGNGGGGLYIYINTQIFQLGCAGFVFAILACAPFPAYHHVRCLFFPESYSNEKTPKEDSTAHLRRTGYKYLAGACAVWAAIIWRGLMFCDKAALDAFSWAVFFVFLLMLAIPTLLSYNMPKIVKAAYSASTCLYNASQKGEIDRNTYRDLLEHGIAYSIVIIQLLATIILKHWKGHDELLIAYLAIWVGCGASCTLLARNLEPISGS